MTRRHRPVRDQRGFSVVLRYIQASTSTLRGQRERGAIAMGHPLGATGAMILGTALDELERRDERRPS
jgi:acetyl-CoA C-acetyltransferase